LVGGVLARSFGLPAPFLVAGVAIPVVTLLILPFVNRRTVEQALAAWRRTPPVHDGLDRVADSWVNADCVT
jgi:hypothetical protein